MTILFIGTGTSTFILGAQKSTFTSKKGGVKMLYTKDKELIKKLRDNAEGKYLRFGQGDIEYIIYTIKKCAKLEEKAGFDSK